MSKVVPISPEAVVKKPDAAADLLTRLNRLEECFLTALQEIHAVRSELSPVVTPTLEKLLNAKTVADILGQSERWVYQQVKTKELPAVRLGKYVMFSPSALQKWIEAQSSV